MSGTVWVHFLSLAALASRAALGQMVADSRPEQRFPAQVWVRVTAQRGKHCSRRRQERKVWHFLAVPGYTSEARVGDVRLPQAQGNLGTCPISMSTR